MEDGTLRTGRNPADVRLQRRPGSGHAGSAGQRHGAARDIDFEVHAHPLDFRDVGALVPGFDVAGSLRLDAAITGSTALMHVRADGETFDGGSLHLEGSLTPTLSDSVRYSLNGRVRDIDPTLWSAGAPPLEGVDADVSTDLRGVSLDSLNGTASLDVSGARLGEGTLRPTHVDVAFESGTATLDAQGAAAPWARVTLHGTARPFDSVPPFDLRGTVHQLQPLEAGGTTLASRGGPARGPGERPRARVGHGHATAHVTARLGGPPSGTER